MPRVGSGDWIDTGTWVDEEDPGAGGQNFTTDVNATGLNGNWMRHWKAITQFFSGYGAVANDKIDGNALKNTIVDDLTLEASASTGTKNFRVKDAGVTAAKLGANAVETAKILDANVTGVKLASDAVTTVKILDANVTAAKLASDAVTTAKILNANVTTAKLEYKEYICQLSQASTANPVAAIISNSYSGALVWTRTGVGMYKATLVGAFTVDKTIVFALTGLGTISFVQAARTDNDIVSLYTRNVAGTLADDLLLLSSVMIRTYP